MNKKLLSLGLLLVMAFSFAACNGQRNNDTNESIEEDTVILEPEVEEFIANFNRHSNFAYDTVLVTLTEEASFENIFYDYVAEDFPGIGAISVEEIDGRTSDTSGLTYMIRQCLLEDPSGGTIPYYLKHNQRDFCIKLDKKNKNYVLRAVYFLEQRGDVDYASPNWLNSGD